MNGPGLKLIRQISTHIVEAVSPEKVILFGSHAYGQPTRDSDLDLLVIYQTEERPVERRRRLDQLFKNRMVPMDFVCLTPREVENRLSGFDPFLEEVLRKGKTLYEKKR